MSCENRAQENVWVDIVKLFCVFMVAIGHCMWTDEYNLIWVNTFVRSCVQMLFIFSGYYLAQNRVLESGEKTKKYVEHLFVMFLFWELLYFLQNMYKANHSEMGWIHDTIYEEAEAFCALNSGHLWYIQNLLLVVLVLYGIGKTNFSKKEVLLSLLLVCIVEVRISRALTGIIFGAYLAQKKRCDSRQKVLLAFLIGIVSMAGMIAFHYTNFGMPYYIGILAMRLFQNLTAVAFSIGVLGLEQLYPIHLGGIGYYVRKGSTIIYLSHMLFIAKAIDFAAWHAEWGSMKYSAICGLYVIMCGTLTSILLIFISGRNLSILRWMKRIY